MPKKIRVRIHQLFLLLVMTLICVFIFSDLILDQEEGATHPKTDLRAKWIRAKKKSSLIVWQNIFFFSFFNEYQIFFPSCWNTQKVIKKQRIA